MTLKGERELIGKDDAIYGTPIYTPKNCSSKPIIFIFFLPNNIIVPFKNRLRVDNGRRKKSSDSCEDNYQSAGCFFKFWIITSDYPQPRLAANRQQLNFC